MKHDRSEIFEKPVWRAIASLCVPSLLSILIMMFYNLTDMYFVAKLDDYVQVGAVSLVSPVFGLLTSLSTMFGNGGCTVLAQELGRGDKRAVQISSSLCIWAAGISGAVLGALGLVFNAPLLRFLGANEELWEPTKEYLLIMLAGAPIVTLSYTLGSLIRGEGAVKAGLIGNLAGTVVNIVLDPIFILALNMGVAGAALATVIGQWIGAFLGFVLNMRLNPEVSLSLRSLRPHGETLARILNIGIPSIIMQSIGSVMTFLMNQILISFSSTAVAVFGVYFKLQSFVFMPVFGLNNGTVPIVAYNYGAKRADRMMQAIRWTVVLAMGIMTLGLLAFQFFAGALLGIFDASEEMIRIGLPALRIISISFPIAGFCIGCGSVFQALGFSVYSMLTSLVRQLFVLIPCAFVLGRVTGDVASVWWAFVIAELFSLLLTVVFFRRVNNRVIKAL